MPDLATLYATYPFWVWIALAAALLAVEVATGSGWLLCPSASAGAVAGLAAFADLGLPQAVLAFAVLPIASTVLPRRYLPPSLLHHPAHDVHDNVARLVSPH